MKRVLMMVALLCGTAGAAQIGVEVGGGPFVRGSVSDLSAGDGSLSFGLSNRAVEAGYALGLDSLLGAAGAVGTLGARLNAAYVFSGGVRLGLSANGTLGPAALTLAGAYWTAPARDQDPLAEFSEAGVSPRAQGWSADLGARYRLRRDLVLLGSGSLGAQPNLAAGVEYRSGAVSYRGGARAGAGVLGATAGLSYRTEEGATLALDGLLGPNSLGLSGSLAISDALGDGSSLRLYSAYEPWRSDARPLRLGAEASLPVGPGTLDLAVRGGPGPAGMGELGLRAGYRFEFPAPPADPEAPDHP